jgi:hypothetical protein
MCMCVDNANQFNKLRLLNLNNRLTDYIEKVFLVVECGRCLL